MGIRNCRSRVSTADICVCILNECKFSQLKAIFYYNIIELYIIIII